MSCTPWPGLTQALVVLLQVEIMMALEEKFEITLDEEGESGGWNG